MTQHRMRMQSDAVQQRLAAIRAKAAELRYSFGDDARARTLEWAATEIDAAIAQMVDECIDLPTAAHASGYSIEHLARLVRTGAIPDRRPPGTRRIRIRRGDLPSKAGTSRSVSVAEPISGADYDPVRAARALLERRANTSPS